MEPDAAIELGRQALFTALLLGTPVLLVGLAVGMIVGLIQTLTQIQDQTVSFVPKVICMVLALAVCLPWLVEVMVEYSQDLFSNIPQLVMSG